MTLAGFTETTFTHDGASRGSSPITEWLRALCRHAHAEIGGKGVGAIGMCLTGNFALALMVDPVVMAPPGETTTSTASRCPEGPWK